MKALAGNMVQSRIIGVNATLKKLKTYRSMAEKGASLGVFKATEFLGNEANKVTPKDTGLLRKSKQTHYTGKGFEKKGMVSYNTPYAIYVHEDLSKTHSSGTYAKFLQKTAWEKRGEMAAIIANEIRKAQQAAASFPEGNVR